jgi:hypothetical protein
LLEAVQTFRDLWAKNKEKVRNSSASAITSFPARSAFADTNPASRTDNIQF